MIKILATLICLNIAIGAINGQEVIGIDVSNHQGKIDWNHVF